MQKNQDRDRQSARQTRRGTHRQKDFKEAERDKTDRETELRGEVTQKEGGDGNRATAGAEQGQPCRLHSSPRKPPQGPKSVIEDQTEVFI